MSDNVSIINARRPDAGIPAEQGGNIATGAQANTAAVLGGRPLTVSSAYGDLDKLVAQLRQEDEQARLTSARQRISVAMTILNSLNVKLSESQTKTLARIEELNEKIEELAKELAGAEVSFSGTDISLAVKTEALEAAVKNQIQAGKDYREAKEKADAAKALDDASRKAAEEALAAASKKLEEANKAVQSATVARNEAVASRSALEAKINGLKGSIDSSNAELAACTKQLGGKVMAEVAAALRLAASDVASNEDRVSAEDERKAEAKEETLDPARTIHESLVKITEELENAIEERRTRNV